MPPHDTQQSDVQLDALIERAAARAASEAVSAAFRNLGLDINDPAALRAWHADQGWTRNAREGSGRMTLSFKTTILSSLATAIMYAVWRLIQSGQPPS